MLWNLLGMGLPTLVGVLVVPVMLHRLGDVRFGIVSIAWVLIGYLGVLDLGLGRALTREIADMRGKGVSLDAQARVARRATLIMLLVGCGWALVLAAQVEIAETGELDLLTARQRGANLLKE